jgi:hypothetical protein
VQVFGTDAPKFNTPEFQRVGDTKSVPVEKPSEADLNVDGDFIAGLVPEQLAAKAAAINVWSQASDSFVAHDDLGPKNVDEDIVGSGILERRGLSPRSVQKKILNVCDRFRNEFEAKSR